MARDKNKSSFHISFDFASSSASSRLSQSIMIDRKETREEINVRNKFSREKLRAKLVGFVDKHHYWLTSVLDMDKEQLILAI